ncbi:MAG: MerR family transcriptional regulator [Candidatus Kapabacteria bacterium]|nr:MerR family transcriptional regulator [Candidatus Kapabacteria bacterium]
MKKLYYSIREICELVNEEQHTLRYWEKEFEELKPKKNRGGNRIYSSKDLLIIKFIKKLLREEKLSLKGAKEQVSKLLHTKNEKSILEKLESNVIESVDVKVTNNSNQKLIDEDLKEIRDLLKNILQYLKKN